MIRLWRTRAGGRVVSRAGVCAVAMFGLALAGCQTEQQDLTASVAPHGATVAFESIDGLPPHQFERLVGDLNREAQTRRLAVLPRGQRSAYRVRGYFAAAVEKGRTTVSWVFDVFDENARRALRIAGSAPVEGRDWSGADAGLMQTVARSSMDELAGFLTSATARPGPNGDQRLALADGSPEASGIFRVAHTDPLPGPSSTAPDVPRR